MATATADFHSILLFLSLIVVVAKRCFHHFAGARDFFFLSSPPIRFLLFLLFSLLPFVWFGLCFCARFCDLCVCISRIREFVCCSHYRRVDVCVCVCLFEAVITEKMQFRACVIVYAVECRKVDVDELDRIEKCWRCLPSAWKNCKMCYSVGVGARRAVDSRSCVLHVVGRATVISLRFACNKLSWRFQRMRRWRRW